MYNQWELAPYKTDTSFHYFEWLCDQVGVSKDYPNSHWHLLGQLWKIEFVWFVPNDDNRIADGLKLRDIYFDYDDTILEYPDGPISVLEVIIGLAIRMDDLLVKPGEDSRVGSRFFELINNLGLLKYSDNRYRDLITTNLDQIKNDISEIERIINVFVDRKYDRNGHGGLFPLNDTPYDQRNIELWYQLNEYVCEKYPYAEDGSDDYW